jgi:hypothetical protein
LIEQPHSAIAVSATGADLRRQSRKASDNAWGTGMAIDTEHPRG